MPPEQAAQLSPAELQIVPALRPASPEAVAQVRRVDVHHHPVPPDYEKAVTPRSGLPAPLRGWSAEKSLADMDRAGVAVAMLSVPASGLWLPDPAANRALARSCNEFMAGLVQRYPGRFGFWAALPLPDIEGCLQEMAYATETLHADGVGLFTSYGAKWLGDPAFTPLMAELDRRSTPVFVHPTTAACCGNLIPGVPEAAVEYGTDTARTIASLLFSGTAARNANMKLIFSHAGGTMPGLIERYELLSRQPNMAKMTPDGALPLLGRFYYGRGPGGEPTGAGRADARGAADSDRVRHRLPVSPEHRARGGPGGLRPIRRAAQGDRAGQTR